MARGSVKVLGVLSGSLPSTVLGVVARTTTSTTRGDPMSSKKQTPNDRRSNIKNPNNPAHKANRDNRANQLNPNHVPTKPAGVKK